MLEVFSSNVTVASGASIPLNNILLLKGCSAALSGANSITFNKCGIYLVTVNANATSADATGEVSIQLAKNGVLQAIPSSETVASTTAIHALSFTALVQVPGNSSKCDRCSVPTTITIENVGNAATIDLNVTVTAI